MGKLRLLRQGTEINRGLGKIQLRSILYLFICHLREIRKENGRNLNLIDLTNLIAHITGEINRCSVQAHLQEFVTIQRQPDNTFLPWWDIFGYILGRQIGRHMHKFGAESCMLLVDKQQFHRRMLTFVHIIEFQIVGL